MCWISFESGRFFGTQAQDSDSSYQTIWSFQLRIDLCYHVQVGNIDQGLNFGYQNQNEQELPLLPLVNLKI